MRSLVLVALLAAGCQRHCSCISPQTRGDVFEQGPFPEAATDVLFVVSDAASMAGPLEHLAASIDAFLEPLAAQDLHLAVVPATWSGLEHLVGNPPIVEGADAEALAARLRSAPTGGEVEQGFDAAQVALTGGHEGFPREEAALVVVFVSTRDDGFGGSPREPEDLEREDGGASLGVSAVVAAGGCGELDGILYQRAAWRGLLSTEPAGGGVADLCASDLATPLAALGEVSTGLRASFQLSYAPVVETLEVLVGEGTVPPGEVDGWTFDDATWLLTFHGDAVPPPGTPFTVRYEIDPAARQL